MFSRRVRRVRRIRTAAVAASVASALVLTACVNDSGGDGDGGDAGPIRIGTTDAGQTQWQVFQQKAEEEGIDIEVENFSEYDIVNRSLLEGELDANQYQHIQYLANYLNEADAGEGDAEDSIVPIASTVIVPLGVYYKDGDSVDDVAGAGEVAIPSDQTNQGRAINVLAQADLVTLRDPDVLIPTPADIDEGKSRVSVTPVDASATATAYEDGTPAIINDNYLESPGLTPDDAVAKDDPSDPAAKPYINVWATTGDRKDDEDLGTLVEIWRSDEVQAEVEKNSNGSAIAVDEDPEELQKVLDETREKLGEQE